MLNSKITLKSPSAKLMVPPCLVQDFKGNVYLITDDGSVIHLTKVKECNDAGGIHSKHFNPTEYTFFEGEIVLSNDIIK